MNILITGATGFVGSGLIQYLRDKPDVNIFAHGRNYQRVNEKLRDLNVTVLKYFDGALLDELKIESVIHLAGIAHDLSNKFKPDDYDKVNFQGTISAFKEFINSNSIRFIFLSSIKAAVDSSVDPVTEEVDPKPTSDYGKSKLRAETYILGSHLSGKKVYVFRPTMIHGKGNKGNLNLLYKYLRSGLPYIFGSYSNQRSFLTAENLNYVLFQFLQNSYPSGIYHIADNEVLSTRELVEIISESLQRRTRIWNLPVSLLDTISKAASLIGMPSERLKRKLTESLVVSNSKLRQTLNHPLPLDSHTGLANTLKSFE